VEDTDNNKLVFLITDGCDEAHYESNTRLQVAALKKLGVEVYVIYIPSSYENKECPDYLQEIASTPQDAHYFPILQAPYYDSLNKPEFMEELLFASCLEIDRITPDLVCNSTRKTISVYGRGFSSTEDLSTFMCKFSVLDCADDANFRDPKTGQVCPRFGGKNIQCTANMKRSCPVSCGTCPDTSAFCADEPEYAKDCPGWEVQNECKTSEEFMHLNCAKSCGVCGLTTAVVISEEKLLCQSPPLGLQAPFNFEITRNGLTWTKGDVKVSTYDCDGMEADDAPLADLISAVTVKTLEPRPTFDENTDAIDISMSVTNTGQKAIMGPITLDSKGFEGDGIVCPDVALLSVGETIVCTGRRAITDEDRASGSIGVTVRASLLNPDGTILESEEYSTDFFFKGAPTMQPTPFPTAKPTTAFPTALPTPFPTQKPTPLPTQKPTPFPTQKPTPFPTARPTAEPTFEPTPMPTMEPTAEPTPSPTPEPTSEPTSAPTAPVVVANANIVFAGVDEPVVVDECPDMFSSLKCIPWWLWLIVGLAVLLIVGAILCVAMRGRGKAIVKGPPPIPEFQPPAPVVAPPVPAPATIKAPPPLPPGYQMLPTQRGPITPMYPTLDEPVVHIKVND
jgi:hypothetical protein